MRRNLATTSSRCRPTLYFAYERDNQVFESMALFQKQRANLTGDASPEVVVSMVTTRSYFRTLGAPIVQGREYSEKEDSPEGSRVVVLSHRAWANRFNKEAAAIGKVIRLDGEPTEIIGVASAALDSTGSPDFFLPLRMSRATPVQGAFGYNAIARLKPGVRAADASTHLIPIVRKFMETVNSATYRAFLTDGDYKPLVGLMKEDLVGELERPLWILLGTVAMLLLVACANVANLFLVRAEGKQREIGIRAALGAGRASLIRHVMAEAFVLAAIGAGLGVLIAAVGLPVLLRAAPPSIPRLDQVVLDWRVLLFAAGVAIVSAFAFGLGRRCATRGRPHSPPSATRAAAAWKTPDGAVRATSSSSARPRLHSFCSSDPACSHAASRASRRRRSDSTRGDVMTFRVSLPATDYKDAAAIRSFQDTLITRLREIPGVESAGAASVLPIANGAPGTAHEFEGRPLASNQLPPMVHYKTIGRGYFETMRIPVAKGRDFEPTDFKEDVYSVIANQALADLYWPGQDPIGKRVRGSSDGATQAPPWFAVVGVVGNERQDGLREPIRPLFYYTPRKTARFPPRRSTTTSCEVPVSSAGRTQCVRLCGASIAACPSHCCVRCRKSSMNPLSSSRSQC
jgi:hypothetical protein